MSSRASVDVADQHNDELVLLAQLIASLLSKWRHFVLSSSEQSEHTTCVLNAPLYFKTSKHSQVGRTNQSKENYTKSWNRNVIEHYFSRQAEKQQTDTEEQEEYEHYNNHCNNSRASKLCECLPRLHWLLHLTKRSLSVHDTRHEVAHKLFDSEESNQQEYEESLSSETSCRCCNTNKKCKCKKCNKINVSEPSYLSSETIKEIVSDVECVLNGMSVLQEDWSTNHTKSSKEVLLIQSLLAECERLQHRYKNLQNQMRQITEQRLSQKEQEYADKKCERTQIRETLSSAQHNNKRATIQTNGLAHKANHNNDSDGNGVLETHELKEAQMHKPHMKTQMELEHKMQEYVEAEINALDSYYKQQQKKREESWECEREQLIEAFTKEYKQVYCLLQEQECKWKVNEQHALQQEETNERSWIVNECESELIDIVQNYFKSLCEWGKQNMHNAQTNTLSVTTSCHHEPELSKCNHVSKKTAFLLDHNAYSPSSANMQYRHTFQSLPRVQLDNDNLHFTEKEKVKEELHSEEQKQENCKNTNIITAAAEHSAESTSHAANSKHESTKLKPAKVLSSTSTSTLISFDAPLSHDANKQPHALLLSASALPLLPSSSSTPIQRQLQKTEKQYELEYVQSSFAPVHFPWQNETSNFTSFKGYCHSRGLPTHSESFTHFLSNEPKSNHQCSQSNKEKCKHKSKELCYYHANNADVGQNTKKVNKLNNVCNKMNISGTTITTIKNNNSSKSCLATPHRTSHVVKSLLLSPLDDRLSNVLIDGVVSEVVSPKKSSSNTQYNNEPDKCHEGEDAVESEKEVTLQTLSRQLTASPSISVTFANHLPHRRLMSPSPENEYLEEEEEEEQQERDTFDNYEHQHYQHNGWNNEETCNRERRETMCQSKEEEERTHTEKRQFPLLGLVNSHVESSNVDIVNILEQQTE